MIIIKYQYYILHIKYLSFKYVLLEAMHLKYSSLIHSFICEIDNFVDILLC